MKLVGMIAALCLASFSVPAIAQDQRGDGPDFSSLRTSDLLIIAGSAPAWSRDACKVGVPLFEELFRRKSDNDRFSNGLVTAAILCADQSGNRSSFIATAGRHKDVLGDREVLDAALQADSADAIIDWMELMAQRDGGSAYADLDPQYYGAIIRKMRELGRTDDFDNLALLILNNGAFDHVQRPIRSYIAYDALRSTVKADRIDMVPDVLRHVRSPGEYASLLTSREFEAAWPMIEEFAGPHMRDVTRRNREWSLAQYEEDKKGRKKLSRVISALNLDGKFEESIRFLRAAIGRRGVHKGMDDQDAWASQYTAQALHALGRFEEADALYDDLSSLPNISFAINRALRLIRIRKKYEDGLEAFMDARELADQGYASTMGKLFIAEGFVCALSQLGRKEEADEEFAYMQENFKTRPASLFNALLCAGREDEAVKLLIDALENDEIRENVIGGFQPALFSPTEQSDWSTPRDLLEKHPELAETFFRYERMMPEEFIPFADPARNSARSPASSGAATD